MKLQLLWWCLDHKCVEYCIFLFQKYTKSRSCLSGQEEGISCAEGKTQTTEVHFRFLSLRESIAGSWKPASIAKRREDAPRYRENNQAQMGDVAERAKTQLCPNGHLWSPGGWHLDHLHPVSCAHVPLRLLFPPSTCLAKRHAASEKIPSQNPSDSWGFVLGSS